MKTDLHLYDHNLSGHMIKLNASIHIISSRVKCIKNCLESLWNNYNSNHNYPVYVYYFDDIYDSLDLQKDIIGDTGQNVVFVTVPYKTPDFIPENEHETSLTEPQQLWMYALFSASILYGIGKVVVDLVVELYDEELNCEPYKKIGIKTLKPFKIDKNIVKALKQISKINEENLKKAINEKYLGMKLPDSLPASLKEAIIQNFQPIVDRLKPGVIKVPDVANFTKAEQYEKEAKKINESLMATPRRSPTICFINR